MKVSSTAFLISQNFQILMKHEHDTTCTEDEISFKEWSERAALQTSISRNTLVSEMRNVVGYYLDTYGLVLLF